MNGDLSRSKSAGLISAIPTLSLLIKCNTALPFAYSARVTSDSNCSSGALSHTLRLHQSYVNYTEAMIP